MTFANATVRFSVGAIACAAAIYLFGWTGTRRDADLQPAATVSQNKSKPAARTVRPGRVITFGFGQPENPQDVPQGWSPIVSEGQMQVAVKSAGDGHGEPVLWLKSDKSSFLLANRSQAFDPEVFRIVRWSWMAISLPSGGDVRENSLLFGSNCNDQALQVLVAFENKRVLSYIWDSTAPLGTEVDEPSFVASVKTRVVDSGSTFVNAWRSQEVNIYEDYRRRFGRPPPKVVCIFVQTNSNHTGSVGEGLIGSITVSDR